MCAHAIQQSTLTQPSVVCVCTTHPLCVYLWCNITNWFSFTSEYQFAMHEVSLMPTAWPTFTAGGCSVEYPHRTVYRIGYRAMWSQSPQAKPLLPWAPTVPPRLASWLLLLQLQRQTQRPAWQQMWERQPPLMCPPGCMLTWTLLVTLHMGQVSSCRPSHLAGPCIVCLLNQQSMPASTHLFWASEADSLPYDADGLLLLVG